MFNYITEISSSQLTNSYFSEGWLNHQPDIKLYGYWIFGDNLSGQSKLNHWPGTQRVRQSQGGQKVAEHLGYMMSSYFICGTAFFWCTEITMKGKNSVYQWRSNLVWTKLIALGWYHIIYIYVYTVKTHTVEVIQTRAIQDALSRDWTRSTSERDEHGNQLQCLGWWPFNAKPKSWYVRIMCITKCQTLDE